MAFSEALWQNYTVITGQANVRELQNIIQRSVILAPSNVIEPEHIPLEEESVPVKFDWIDKLPIGKTLRLVETHFILETLRHHNGNRTHAAKTLGISLRTLRNKINEYTSAGHDVTAPFWGRTKDEQ